MDSRFHISKERGHLKRIGVTQRVELIDAPHLERRDCLDQRWTAFLAAAGLLSIPLPNAPNLAAALLADLGLDGMVLTGGNDLAGASGGHNTAPERDAFEAIAIEHCQYHRIPVIGVCRGMQMLLSRTGMALNTIPNHAGTQHTITAHKPLPDFPMARRVNSYHRYGLKASELTTPWEILATSPDGTVEGVIHSELNHMGIMWHPERGEFQLPDLSLFRTFFEGDHPCKP